MKKLILAAALISALPAAFAQRIIPLTSDVADIVVALGAGKDVVARELTTQNPALKNVPTIGIFGKLTVEPIAAQKPTLVIGSWMAQPQNIYANLNQIHIKAVNVEPKDDLLGYPDTVRKIGQLIGKTQQANALASKWQSELKPQSKTGKRYLISYDGRYVAGRNTAADQLIRQAGGINAAAEIDGLKPMTREAWLAAKPDIILISEHHKKTIGGISNFAKRPEVANSVAAKTHHIYFWPAHEMFHYGLNTPKVLQRLHQLAK